MNLSIVLPAVALVGLSLPLPAVAQEETASPAADGAALSDTNCALCHGAEGEGGGYNGRIPALAENPFLGDPTVPVTYVHQGMMEMPPFPWLTDEEVAAIASFVRANFGNAFGPVSAEEVAAIRARLRPLPEVITIWDGVFSQDQAERGQEVAEEVCAACHGAGLNGVPEDHDLPAGPPLAGPAFLNEWAGRPLGALFTFSHLLMPLNNPGSLDPADYGAVVAYMLSSSGVPAGDRRLLPMVAGMQHIRITAKP
jgi:mono/diheme cytochrome c family protein